MGGNRRRRAGTSEHAAAHAGRTGGHSGCACDFRGGVLLALRVFGFWSQFCCDTLCDLSEQNCMPHFYAAYMYCHQTVSPRATFISFRNVVAAPDTQTDAKAAGYRGATIGTA